MKRLILLLACAILAAMTPPGYADSSGELRAKCDKIMNNVSYHSFQAVKVLEFKTNPTKSLGNYESYIKIKSCYNIDIKCDAIGKFSDEYGGTPTVSERVNKNTRAIMASPVLFSGVISKNGTSEQTGMIRMPSEKFIGIFEGFQIKIHCSLAEYDERKTPAHLLKLELYLPKNNECRD